MADKKIIAVVGATGAQGGGLVRAILEDADGPFAARALTRNPDSDKAAALRDLGAEVVRTDIDDLASVEAAFDGAYGAFCVTNYWEYFSTERETAQARNLAEAASRANLQHVIWSTLEDTRRWVPLDDDSMPTLMERHKVPHFEGKAEADAEFTDRGVPTTFLLASFYWENFIYFGSGPARGEDGSLNITLPMGESRLAGIAAEDIGRCAYGIFKNRDAYVGKVVGIAGDHLTIQEIADEMSDALGLEIGYNDVPADVFRSFGFPGAADVGNMFQFYRDFSEDVLRTRDIEESRRLNPRLQPFGDWLAENGARIPIP